MPADSVIVVMAKQPQVGRTKTRLCPPFEPGEAAAFYEAILCDSLVLASGQQGVDLAVAITPPESRSYFERIAPPGSRLLVVTGADIGECLARSTADLFAVGYRRVLALNADGPSLPPSYLCEAVSALESNDLVLGPGEDGGYYLVGMTQPRAALFSEIAWSSDLVLTQTIERARALNLHTHLLPPWYDVDTPADARRLARELDTLSASRMPHTRAFLAGFARPCLFL
jgi:hypothetical protein